MAIKNGAKIVAHTRLAVESDGTIALFVPGEIITVGTGVTAEQAKDWLDRGSAAVPTAEDVSAWDVVLDARAEAEKARRAAERDAAKDADTAEPAAPAA